MHARYASEEGLRWKDGWEQRKGGKSDPDYLPFFIITIAINTLSLTTGLVFIRFSRPGKRALTVLFSDRATLGPISHTESRKGAAEGTGEGVPLALSFRVTELTYVCLSVRVCVVEEMASLLERR